MIYLVSMVVANLILAFFMAWHGLIGAVLFGLDILVLDFFWQWVRWRRLRVINSLEGNRRIVFGFVIRLANVLLGLKIGQAWLTPHCFLICAFIVLMLPLMSIYGVYLLNRGVFIDGNIK
jgi:hypothetical protein